MNDTNKPKSLVEEEMFKDFLTKEKLKEIIKKGAKVSDFKFTNKKIELVANYMYENGVNFGQIEGLIVLAYTVDIEEELKKFVEELDKNRKENIDDIPEMKVNEFMDQYVDLLASVIAKQSIENYNTTRKSKFRKIAIEQLMQARDHILFEAQREIEPNKKEKLIAEERRHNIVRRIKDFMNQIQAEAEQAEAIQEEKVSDESLINIDNKEQNMEDLKNLFS